MGTNKGKSSSFLFVFIFCYTHSYNKNVRKYKYKHTCFAQYINTGIFRFFSYRESVGVLVVVDSETGRYSLSATLLSDDIGSLCTHGSQDSVISTTFRHYFPNGIKADQTSLIQDVPTLPWEKLVKDHSSRVLRSDALC